MLGALFILPLLITLATSFYNQCLLDLFPLPQNCSIGNPQQNISITPCDINLRIYDQKLLPHFNQLVNQYMINSYNCTKVDLQLVTEAPQISKSSSYRVDILILDPTLRSVFTTIEEAYMINADTNNATIRAGTYVSLVRAFDTFLQLITNQPETQIYSLNSLPLYIYDQPQFSHRGVQIDTARHYLPFPLILQTIDSMMYNKMNVLHWHITDQDSFPLKLTKHPELAEYGAFSKNQIYTSDQAREVVRYAKVRGIRVIPELDTPGHAASWGKAPKNKGLACTLSQYTFIGPLDVTLQQTYTLVKQVFEEILDIFPDPYVHLGGDEVQLSCLSNLTSVLRSNNITVSDLPMHYRQRQKDIISKINPNKQRIYWQNNFDHLKTFTANDVIHWWGDGNLPNTTSKIIISTFGPFYIDMGVGNYFGMPYGLYSNWLDLYNQNIYELISNYGNKGNVLGAAVLLWSELSNKYTHMTKLWLRSSAIAERLWNPFVEMIKPRVILRMNYHMKRLNSRGIPTAPITNQVCQKNPIFC